MPRRSTMLRSVLVSCSVLLVLLAPAGCYRKVVGAKGFGADQYDISESDVRANRPGGENWIRSTTDSGPRTSTKGGKDN